MFFPNPVRLFQDRRRKVGKIPVDVSGSRLKNRSNPEIECCDGTTVRFGTLCERFTVVEGLKETLFFVLGPFFSTVGEGGVGRGFIEVFREGVKGLVIHVWFFIFFLFF